MSRVGFYVKLEFVKEIELAEIIGTSKCRNYLFVFQTQLVIDLKELLME